MIVWMDISVVWSYCSLGTLYLICSCVKSASYIIHSMTLYIHNYLAILKGYIEWNSLTTQFEHMLDIYKH